jgi:putative PIN family toxin of toxin-antitoxin system
LGEKIVLDTNVWLSILFKKRISEGFVPLIEEGTVEVFTSRPLLRELARVLTYPRVEKMILAADLTATMALATVAKSSKLVKTRHRVNLIKADPPDNRVLECGLASRATTVVSGDRHLLSLKEFRGMKVTKPGEFLARFGSASRPPDHGLLHHAE